MHLLQGNSTEAYFYEETVVFWGGGGAGGVLYWSYPHMDVPVVPRC